MKKAVAAVLLAVLLVCAVFSSCGKKEDGAVTRNGNTTRSAAQNAVTNAGDAVGDAVTGAGDVVTGAADIAGDVITGAGDIVNDAATGAGEAASKAVSDAAR